MEIRPIDDRAEEDFYLAGKIKPVVDVSGAVKCGHIDRARRTTSSSSVVLASSTAVSSRAIRRVRAAATPRKDECVRGFDARPLWETGPSSLH